MSKSWSATLRLPKSTLPPRPLPPQRDHYIQLCADNLYEWQARNRPADDPFVVHDGPPYANGDLHVGHALNKILKDMINRVKVQQGRRVHYVPGWDCHGLPIELKALEKAKSTRLSPVETRRSAQSLAADTVLRQMQGFKSYGVMADWENRWTTMDAAFELRQLRLFQQMVKKGLIYRKFKPVYWSPSSKTALAEAELEYRDDHVSNTAWIRFPLAENWHDSPELDSIRQQLPERLCAVIWTTTPWTLPANQAIGVHGDLSYCVLQTGSEGLLVAESRVDSFLETLKTQSSAADFRVVATLKGSQLAGLRYTNRLKGTTAPSQPIIHADFVSADSGTGMVHLAPGHGMDDYLVCTSLGIPVTAPIDDEGRFTSQAFPDDPSALVDAPSVAEGGSQAVLDLLKAHGDVLVSAKYTHKYPYDWRTKKPVVVRATEQWFADVACIKSQTLEALSHVRFMPDSAKNRLESFVKGRSEWCISRQRSWGVPIPALYDEDGAAVVSEAVVDHIISVIRERGTDAWWSDAPDEPAWIPSGMGGRRLRRGTDTMDVWFDSGSSWAQMSRRADVYLEGTDQHRGWFQSSLLTRIASEHATAGVPADITEAASARESGAPFKQLITHGFTLDLDGKKMSKSLGNVMGPQEVMDGTLLPPVKRKGKAAKGLPPHDALGPDALRLWVASSDYTRDVAIGVPILQSVHIALIKYRTILKMLLGSMHEAARRAPLTTADHMALVHLQDAMGEVGQAFDGHEFYRGVSVLNRWVTTDLSAFYLEGLKDRLYCGDGGGVLEPIFMGFCRMLAPITPLLVAEAWEHRPEWMKQDTTLINPLHQLYAEPLFDAGRKTIDDAQLRLDMPWLMSANTAVKAALEAARLDKAVGSSLQGRVRIVVAAAPPHPPPASPGQVEGERDVPPPPPPPQQQTQLRAALARHAADLADLFVVSRVELSFEGEEEEEKGAGPAGGGAQGNADEMSEVPHDAERDGAGDSAAQWRYVRAIHAPTATATTTSTTTTTTGPTNNGGSGSSSSSSKVGTVLVLPPEQAKCPRCWRYVAPAEDELCGRCEDVVAGQ